jgi:hypothetical protein
MSRNDEYEALMAHMLHGIANPGAIAAEYDAIEAHNAYIAQLHMDWMIANGHIVPDAEPVSYTMYLTPVHGATDSYRDQSAIRAYDDPAIALGYGHGHLPGFLKTYEGQIAWLAKNVPIEPGLVTEIIPHPKTDRKGVKTNTRTFTIRIGGEVKSVLSFRTDELSLPNIQDAIKAFGSKKTPSFKKLDTPEANAAELEGIFVYSSEHINGASWEKMDYHLADPLKRLGTVLPSLGKLLCVSHYPSATERNEQLEMIATHINLILGNNDPEVRR